MSAARSARANVRAPAIDGEAEDAMPYDIVDSVTNLLAGPSHGVHSAGPRYLVSSICSGTSVRRLQGEVHGVGSSAKRDGRLEPCPSPTRSLPRTRTWMT